MGGVFETPLGSKSHFLLGVHPRRDLSFYGAGTLPGWQGQSSTGRALKSVSYRFITSCLTRCRLREASEDREAEKPERLLRDVESRVTEAPTREHCFQLPRSGQFPGENSELMDAGQGVADPGREPREQKE